MARRWGAFVTAASTPFNDCIAIVEDIQSVVAKLDSPGLQHPLSDVIDLLGDAIDLLSIIPYVDDAWNVVTAATNAIGGALDTITACTEVVPGLDAVMDVLDVIYNFIDGIEDLVDGALDLIVAVANDVVPILRDICTGLRDIQTLIQDMATELPALVNTLKILQALAEIVEAIAPVFKEAADGSTVAAHLETVLGDYDKVNSEVSKAVAPLKTAIHAVEPALHALGSLASEMKTIAGGAFATIEKDFQSAANSLASAEHTAMGVAESLAPVRKVLDAVKSVMEKVIRPIIRKIEHMVGLTALENLAVSAIEKELGISAIQSFNSFNGKPGSQKTDGYHQNQGAAGSKKGQAMRDFWGDVGKSLEDYKRGDSKSAVESAVEALLDAITGGTVDLQKTPPIVQKKDVQLYIPKVAPLPSRVELARGAAGHAEGMQLRIERHCRQPLAVVADVLSDPTTSAVQVASAAQDIAGSLSKQPDWLAPFNSAAMNAISAITVAAPAIAPAAQLLGKVAGYSSAPSLARSEIASIAMIASAINDVVGRLITLYPSETGGLSNVAASIEDLASRLNKLAVQEAALVPVLAQANAQINSVLKQIAPIAHISAHATALGAIAASGATTAQLFVMLDSLNVALAHPEDSALTKIEASLSDAAAKENENLQEIVSDVRQLASALDQIKQTGGNVLGYYQGVAHWGAPVAKQWLPMLLDAAKYAHVIDSILAPLSYLLQAGGCAAPPEGAGDQDQSMGQLVKQEALEAAHYIRDGAIVLLKDVLDALPKLLEELTADALNVPEMETLLTGANATLASDIEQLVKSGGQINKALLAIKAGTRPPQNYSWTITDSKGETKTIEISNVFFSQSDAESIGSLAGTMVRSAIAKGLPLPEPSPLIQKWSTE